MENEAALGALFGQFGTFVHATVRHRIQDPDSPDAKLRGTMFLSRDLHHQRQPRANTSWAIVTMADAESVETVLSYADKLGGLVVGSTMLQVTRFSPEAAASSTGQMGAVLQTEELLSLFTLQQAGSEETQPTIYLHPASTRPGYVPGVSTGWALVVYSDQVGVAMHARIKYVGKSQSCMLFVLQVEAARMLSKARASMPRPTPR